MWRNSDDLFFFQIEHELIIIYTFHFSISLYFLPTSKHDGVKGSYSKLRCAWKLTNYPKGNLGHKNFCRSIKKWGTFQRAAVFT